MKKLSLLALIGVMLFSMTAFVSQNTDGDRLLEIGRAHV